jgi:hypothetical protein
MTRTIREIAREAAHKATNDYGKSNKVDDPRFHHEAVADAVAVAVLQEVKRYRPQHDEDCLSRWCIECGDPVDSYRHGERCNGDSNPCSCGLSSLLSLPVVERPIQTDEEMVPHPFNSRTPYEAGDDRDIWCKDCEYHRDHSIHAIPDSPVVERSQEEPNEKTEDHARSDQPQLRAGESDPRDDQRGDS